MRILVAVDGSSDSRVALDTLAQRGLRAGAVVRLVAVAAPHSLFGAVEQDDEDLAEKTVLSCASYLSGLAPTLEIETASLAGGNIAAVIVEEAERWGADLIAVGSRGNSLLESVLMGSVSQGILSRSTIPVFVARKTNPEAAGNILIAVDDSECATAAVEWLATQWWANGKTIALVTVVEDMNKVVGPQQSIKRASDALITWQTEVGSLQIGLNFLADYLASCLPQSTIHHGVLQGEPREVIVKAAQKWPAEVILLGSHGRRGIDKLFGSVSRYVTVSVDCSVENVRGQSSQLFQQLHDLVEHHRLNSPLTHIAGEIPQSAQGRSLPGAIGLPPR